MRLSQSCLGIPAHSRSPSPPPPTLTLLPSSPSRPRAIPPLKSHQGRRTRGHTEGHSEEGQGRRGSRAVRDASSTGSRSSQHRTFSLSPTPFLILRSRVIVFLSPNRFLFSVGQILQVVQIPDKILSRFGACCAVSSFERLSQRGHLSERHAVAVLWYI